MNQIERVGDIVPLVFVHGVGNRKDAGFAQQAAYRELLARLFLLPAVSENPTGTAVLSPLWGDLAGVAYWNHASVPGSGIESLGPADTDLADDLVASALEAVRWGAADPDTLLLTLAGRDLNDAVDVLYAEAGAHSETGGLTTALNAAVPVLAYLRAREGLFPEVPSHERYPWLREVRDDQELVARLLKESDGWRFGPDGTPCREAPELQTEILGWTADPLHALPEAVGRLRRKSMSALQQPFSSRLFSAVSATTTACLGDILVYLSERGTAATPGPIVTTVIRDLEAARRLRTAEDPLMVVAHSMGGNIVYDILTHFRPGLAVDILVTAGSQVGYFEELKLFHASSRTVPTATTPKVGLPKGLGRWLNVVDPNDPLAFAAAPIFEGVEDYRYPSGALWAHSGYLRQPNFYQRLGTRLRSPRP